MRWLVLVVLAFIATTSCWHLHGVAADDNVDAGTVIAAAADATPVVTEATPAASTAETESPEASAAPEPEAEGVSEATTAIGDKYVSAPIPVAAVDSDTFRKVDNILCTDAVASQVMTIYSKNRAIFDACQAASEYQIFPFSGKLPTKTQITAMAKSRACTALFTACVLANMPQCDISGLGLKGVTESLLKVTVDVDNGLPAPDNMLFHDIHTWRRDSNLAQAAGVPFGNDSQLYTEFTTNLWAALTRYSVRVAQDLTITYDDADGSTTGTDPRLFPPEFFFGKTKAGAGHAAASSSSDQSDSSAGEGDVGSGSQSNSAVTRPSGTGRLAALLLGIATAWLLG